MMKFIKPVIALCILSTFFSCKPTLSVDCSKALIPADPVPIAKFRLLSATGNNDLIADNTVQFDSLMAMQPCNIEDSVKKKLVNYGTGGYAFYFDDMRQPVVNENAECYKLVLKWSSTDTDEIEYVVRGVFDECGTVYHLDKVLFNGKQVALQDGYYILRK